MTQDATKLGKGRIAQAGAVSVGTIIVFLGKLESINAIAGQILVHLAPFLTILTSVGLVWGEDVIRTKATARKAKKSLSEYLDYCDSHLKDESLALEVKTVIQSRRNQAQMAAIHEGFHEVLKNFPSASTSHARVKRANKKPQDMSSDSQ